MRKDSSSSSQKKSGLALKCTCKVQSEALQGSIHEERKEKRILQIEHDKSVKQIKEKQDALLTERNMLRKRLAKMEALKEKLAFA